MRGSERTVISAVFMRVVGVVLLTLVGCTDSLVEPGPVAEAVLYAVSDTAAPPGTGPCAASDTLTTQAEVDAFACTAVGGGLTIGPSADITNLDALSSLTSVRGPLRFRDNTGLTNVDGLSSLTTVGDLAFGGNTSLANLDGLSSLHTISNILIVGGGNNALTNLDGLSSLTSVPTVEAGTAPALVRVRLPALTTPLQTLRLVDNPQLVDVSLPAVQSINSVVVHNNPALTLPGFA